MGAQFVTGVIEGFNWRDAWDKAYKESVEYLGNNPYSGGINTLDYMRYEGKAPFNENNAYEYVNKRCMGMSSREGSGWDLGIDKYAIINTIYELQSDDKEFQHMLIDCSSMMGKGPSTLLVRDNIGRVRGYKGTFSDLKAEGHIIARTSNYSNDVLIKNSSGNVYAVNGSVKWVKNTKRKTDKDTLVLEWHKFYFCGWCAS